MRGFSLAEVFSKDACWALGRSKPWVNSGPVPLIGLPEVTCERTLGAHSLFSLI